jgi:UDPglucose 6-dehydrogenase
MAGDQTLAVFGLGKLGLPLAAVMASRGFRVIGVDHDEDHVGRLQERRWPLTEPGLAELLESSGSRFRATTDGAAAVAESEASFILVPTNAEEDEPYSNRRVLQAIDAIGAAIAGKDNYHLVVLMSTVLPGTVVRERLEARSGKRCGVDFGLCHNPEFVALGTVVRDMRNPDYIVIGADDENAGDRLAEVYATLCENEPQVVRTNLINAELIKLAINNYVTVKISFANTLAGICESLPGADVETVTSAVGLDGRIGKKFFKGGLSYGGPCFPRDNQAWRIWTEALGCGGELVAAAEAVNARRDDKILEMVKNHLPDGGRVAVLGLAYKPDTDVVEASPGMRLAQSLVRDGYAVSAYDPCAMRNAAKILDPAVHCAESMRSCLADAQLIAIMTPWEEFRALGPGDFYESPSHPVVLDCWRILDASRLENFASIINLGIFQR